LLVWGAKPLMAQVDSIVIDTQTQQIILDIQNLPPLDTLIKYALNSSPLLKSREALVGVKENELRKVKHDWLDIFSVGGNVGYGNGMLDVNQSNISEGIVTNSNTVRFGLSLQLRLSPSYWVERKHDINIKKAHLAYEEAMFEESQQIIRHKITQAYLEVKYYQALFHQAVANYEASRVTMKFNKHQFLEGQIDIELYNNVQLKHNKLAMNIENYKMNLKKSYYILKQALK